MSSSPASLASIAKKNFAKWNAALLTKDAKKVADLYTSDATFLPTVSPEFKKGREGAEDYFHHFLEKDPEGEVVEEVVQPISIDCYLQSGLYNFAVGPKEKREIVAARFTFLWQRGTDGQWRIAHHHSSKVP
jgi:uncharacterized protein (TIGR02246 family)